MVQRRPKPGTHSRHNGSSKHRVAIHTRGFACSRFRTELPLLTALQRRSERGLYECAPGPRGRRQAKRVLISLDSFRRFLRKERVAFHERGIGRRLRLCENTTGASIEELREFRQGHCAGLGGSHLSVLWIDYEGIGTYQFRNCSKLIGLWEL
jgi:hypothetical protein